MGIVSGHPGSPYPTPEEDAAREKETRNRVMELAMTDRSSNLYKNWKVVLLDSRVTPVADANDWCNLNCKMAWVIEKVETLGFKDIPDRRYVFRSPKDAALFRMFFG